ncbi:SDR family NAD(P)-dependent oxidoreductase [Actinocorallia longicatena]
MSRLEGRTALVTGGSRGIGRAIATRLAAEGATVAVHYGGNEEAAAKTVADIRGAGGEAFAIRADLRTPGAAGELAEGVCAEFRDGLDILVNNAGILNNAPVGEVTERAWDELFTINMKAPFFLVQALLPALRDDGRIINLSSVNARLATPTIIEYSMSKAALESMSRTLAAVLAPRRITVNAVAPGATETDMMAFVHAVPELKAMVDGLSVYNRMALPEEVASAVALLCSPDSALITGQVVDVSGGTWLGPPS